MVVQAIPSAAGLLSHGGGREREMIMMIKGRNEIHVFGENDRSTIGLF